MQQVLWKHENVMILIRVALHKTNFWASTALAVKLSPLNLIIYRKLYQKFQVIQVNTPQTPNVGIFDKAQVSKIITLSSYENWFHGKRDYAINIASI